MLLPLLSSFPSDLQLTPSTRFPSSSSLSLAGTKGQKGHQRSLSDPVGVIWCHPSPPIPSRTRHSFRIFFHSFRLSKLQPTKLRAQPPPPHPKNTPVSHTPPASQHSRYSVSDKNPVIAVFELPPVLLFHSKRLIASPINRILLSFSMCPAT